MAVQDELGAGGDYAPAATTKHTAVAANRGSVGVRGAQPGSVKNSSNNNNTRGLQLD